MDEFIKALIFNLKSENWYGALFLALTLPDICGKIEYPNKSSSKRYPMWFQKYVQKKYTIEPGFNGEKKHVFLSGDDCYALRCALLHEGSVDIASQAAQDVLETFHFTKPGPNVVHTNHDVTHNTLQLQIDLFARDIIEGIIQWVKDIEHDSKKMEALFKLMRIYDQ